MHGEVSLLTVIAICLDFIVSGGTGYGIYIQSQPRWYIGVGGGLAMFVLFLLLILHII